MILWSAYLQFIPSLGAGHCLGAAPWRKWLFFLNSDSDKFAEMSQVKQKKCDPVCRVVSHKHNSAWTWLLLIYFSEVNKFKLHIELIPISEHQHDFKFSWSWSTVIYLLSTYTMVGIFQMFKKLSIDGS